MKCLREGSARWRGLNGLHFWFTCQVYNLYHLDLEWNKDEDNTCVDVDAWCVLISKFECNENQVQEKCPKACNQCNSKQALIH